MKTKVSHSGLTLLEMLIAIGIFALILTMVGSLFVNGYQVYSSQQQSGFVIREDTLGFSGIVNNLKQMTDLYQPGNMTQTNFSAYDPQSGVNVPLTFTIFNFNAGKYETIGYTLNSQKAEILELLYEPDYSPTVSSTWNVLQTHVLANSVKTLEFVYHTPDSGTNQFFSASINFSTPPHFSLSSDVHVFSTNKTP